MRHKPEAGDLGSTSRRTFLQVGSLGATGLCLSDLLRLRRGRRARQQRRHVRHTYLAVGWAVPPRNVRYEAGRAKRVSRRVPFDPQRSAGLGRL